MKLYILTVLSAITIIGCKSEVADRYFQMGVSDDSVGNYFSSMINYSEAIKFNPAFAVAYNNRGFARLVLKDTNGALDDYNMAIKCDNLALSYYNKGCIETMRKQYPKAIDDYSKAIELFHDSIVANMAYNNRGFCEDELNRFDVALSDYNHSITLKPSRDGYYNKATLEEEMGDTVVANSDFMKVLNIEPTDSHTHFQLGIIKEKHLKDYIGAINEFTLAIKIDSTYSKAYYCRGLAYIVLMKKDSGCIDLFRAKSRGCKDTCLAIEKYCRNN